MRGFLKTPEVEDARVAGCFVGCVEATAFPGLSGGGILIEVSGVTVAGWVALTSS